MFRRLRPIFPGTLRASRSKGKSVLSFESRCNFVCPLLCHFFVAKSGIRTCEGRRIDASAQ